MGDYEVDIEILKMGAVGKYFEMNAHTNSFLPLGVYDTAIEAINFSLEFTLPSERLSALSALKTELVNSRQVYSRETPNYHQGDIAVIESIIEFINNKIASGQFNKTNELKTFKIVKSVSKPSLLVDIWKENKTGTKDYYEEVIKYLCQYNSAIGEPFLSDKENNLTWTQMPKNGRIQYLAAFIYTCIEKGWIDNKYSSREYRDILCRTFTIQSFAEKPFKSLKSNPPDSKYLDAFKFIKVNK